MRPTAFFKSLSGQVERVRSGKPFLVFGDSTLTACKPIGEADIANYLVDCLDNPACHNKILPIGGPGEAVTPRQHADMLFGLLGLPARIRRVPIAVFNVGDAILAPLARFWPTAASKAELARIGRYYATESMLLWNEK